MLVLQGGVGVADADLPDKPKLKWTFKSGAPIKSSAAVADGRTQVMQLADVYRAVEKRPAIQLHRGAPSKTCVVGRNILPLLDEVVGDVETAALRRLSGTTVAELAAQALRRG